MITPVFTTHPLVCFPSTLGVAAAQSTFVNSNYLLSKHIAVYAIAALPQRQGFWG